MAYQDALSAGELVSLRGDADTAAVYWGATYISVCPNTNVYTARINQSSFGSSVTQFEYDGGSGTLANVEIGMTILISHTSDRSEAHWRGRIRAAPDADTIFINEASADFEDDDYVFILDDFAIWDKLGRWDDELKPDYDVSYRELLPIIYGLQGAYADWISSDTDDKYEIAFTPSALATESGASISSWSWDVGDGSITVGSDSDQNITARFPDGFRHVYLTVTDDNGNSITRKIPVWAHDPDSPTNLLLYVGDLEAFNDRDFGPNGSLPAFDGIDALLDGTLVCAWVDERYNGSVTHIENNIALIGRLRTEASTSTYDDIGQLDAETRFEIEGPLQQLERLELRPMEIENDSSPTKFNEVNDLTPWRAIVLTLTEYSTFCELHSLEFWDTSNDYEYKGDTTPEGSILAAINYLAESVNAALEMDWSGQAQVVRNAMLLEDDADRDALVTVADWDTQDILGLSYDKDHARTLGWIESHGGSYKVSKNKIRVAHSVAPGTAPGESRNTAVQEGQVLAANQSSSNAETELNKRSGHAFAYKQTATRLFVTHPDGYWFLPPARDQWHTFTLDGTETAREVTFDTDDRWLLESITVRHDLVRGTKDVQADYRLETKGFPGTAVNWDDDWEVKLPDFDIHFPPLPQFEIDGLGAWQLNRGTSTIAVFCGSGNFYTTANWGDTGGPTWAEHSMGLDGADTFLNGNLEVDPASPLYIGSGTTVNCWVVGQDKIYYITDVFGVSGGPSTAIQHSFNVANVGRRAIHAQRSTAGRVVITSYYGNDGSYPGVYAAYTTDGGSTWTEVQVSAHYNTGNPDAGALSPGVYTSVKTNGLVLCTAFTATGAGAACDVFKSTDGGATWAADTARIAGSTVLAWDLHVPYNDNASDLIAYMNAQASKSLVRINGNSLTDISPTISGTYYGVDGGGRWRVHSYPLDRQIMVAALGERGGTGQAIFTSIDAGDTWTLQHEHSIDADKYLSAGIAGNDPNVIYLCGGSTSAPTTGAAALGFMVDGVLYDMNGNINVDFSPGAARFLIGG